MPKVTTGKLIEALLPGQRRLQLWTIASEIQVSTVPCVKNIDWTLKSTIVADTLILTGHSCLGSEGIVEMTISYSERDFINSLSILSNQNSLLGCCNACMGVYEYCVHIKLYVWCCIWCLPKNVLIHLYGHCMLLTIFIFSLGFWLP